MENKFYNANHAYNYLWDYIIKTGVDFDNTKAILKYEGRKPSCFYNMETYSHEEILIELANSSWVSEE